MKRFLTWHSATIVLFTAWISCLIFTRVAIEIWPKIKTGEESDTVWWVYQTVLSNEADVFGGFVLILVSKWLSERGSPETGDDPSDGEPVED